MSKQQAVLDGDRFDAEQFHEQLADVIGKSKRDDECEPITDPITAERLLWRARQLQSLAERDWARRNVAP